MDRIEIIQTAIPLECCETKTTELINTLLQIDEILFKHETGMGDCRRYLLRRGEVRKRYEPA